MSKTWQLQEAKAKFSELFNEVLESGPQFVSRHGKERIVCISEKDYRVFTGREEKLLSFLLSAPRTELDLSRNKDTGRDVRL